jgi:hypothetical protein
MVAFTERALVVFETIDSPMLHANFLTDAARLAVAHGLPVDEQRLRQAAELSLAFGYGGQARQLIGLSGIDSVLSLSVLHELMGIAQRAESRDIHPARRPSNAP